MGAAACRRDGTRATRDGPVSAISREGRGGSCQAGKEDTYLYMEFCPVVESCLT